MRLGESEGCCPEDEVRRVYEWLEAALAGGQGGDPANGFDD